MKTFKIKFRTVFAFALLQFPLPLVSFGQTFENVYPFPPKSFMTAMRWRWNRKPVAWPKSRPLTVTHKAGEKLSGDQAAITWIGHSSFLVEFENFRVLLDPVYSKFVGPSSLLGTSRVIEAGISLEQTPKVDLILVSHDHFDHMDLPTLEFFAKRDNPLIIAGRGNKTLLEETGFSKIVELLWWEKHTVNSDVQVTFVPAQHWSTRSLLTRNTTLWGGFYFKVRNKTYYFAGDTGYHPKLFREIHERAGAPDFAFIPVGAYAPRDFMRDQHVDPAEAVDIHKDVKAKQSVGMHHSTFQLTDEGIDEPCLELKSESKSKGLAGGDFTCMETGETRFLNVSDLQAEK
jgi:L-ascorbate metabolism protein UlaG (beta-lactamase superfamily)